MSDFQPNIALIMRSDDVIEKFNLKQVDALSFSKNGTLEQELNRLFD